MTIQLLSRRAKRVLVVHSEWYLGITVVRIVLINGFSDSDKNYSYFCVKNVVAHVLIEPHFEKSSSKKFFLLSDYYFRPEWFSSADDSTNFYDNYIFG